MRYNNSPLIGMALGAILTVSAIAASKLATAANVFQALDLTRDHTAAQRYDGGHGTAMCGAYSGSESNAEGKLREGKYGASFPHNEQPR